VSTHTVLGVDRGQFISATDPPDAYRQASAELKNDGTWPVLVGEEGQRDLILSSPIILYDYPQVAPESPGDWFDATEIDEMLDLRTRTLTDNEKHWMRSVDEHARRLLERTERADTADLANLHGALRGLRRLDTANR
jgi:hydrogenase maturation protease